ncbi:hypothetical protein MTP99_004726 [Tenebrio molitor]|nr:hypothetical protein MTP99_004726 [Tenebrio molitor]
MQKPEKTQLKRKIHPKDRANCLSHFLFCWQLPIIIKYYKNDFTEENLYSNLAEHSSEDLGNELEEKWHEEEKSCKRPSLFRVLYGMFGRKYIAYGVLMLLLELATTFLTPLCLKQFLKYFDPQEKSITKQEACMTAFAIVLLNLLRVLYTHQLYLEFTSLGIKVQIACSSLVYRKYLKLKKETCQKFTLGQMVNLLSNDVERFHDVFVFFHNTWIGPLKIVLGLYYLNVVLGKSAMVGFLILFLFIFIQAYTVRHMANQKLKVARKTDHRIRLMDDIICGIQVIKMYTWEKPFSKLVEISRKTEIAQLLKPNLLRITNFCFCIYLGKIAVFFCVLTTLLTKLPFTAQYFFALLNFYTSLALTVTRRMAYAFIFFAEAKSSLQRIEKFLLCEHQEFQHLSNKEETYNKIVDSSLSLLPRPSGFCIKHVVVKFEKNAVLNDVSLEASSGELVGIAGADGSGKSTLLQVILKEIEPTTGFVDVKGAVSYAVQEAWIFSASVRQNILFGEEMDLEKYQKVIRVCALEEDLSLFPHGDQTLVGERGVMLSGGQKARISLARAVYRDADIYLLDDPLSAVDAHVAEHIFNECLLNYLKNKSVVLVTHQVKYLSKVNQVYFIENGKLTAGETLNKANKYVNAINAETIALKKYDAVSEVKEHRSSEATSPNPYKKYCFAGHWLMCLFILLMFGFAQFINSSTDFFVAFWIDLTENPNHFSFEWKKILSPQNFLTAYASLTVILVLSVHLLSLFYVKYFIKVSNKFHKALFDTILKVPIKFFNDHSSGRILNRFSKDMVCIDQRISVFLFEIITLVFNVIGIFVVISISNLWLTFPAIALIILFYIFAHLFKPINKNIRRTEAIVKSPVLNHFVATVRGLTTIRALDAQKCLQQEFDHHQDVHASAFYLLKAMIYSFTFWVDMICVIYIVLIIFSFLLFETQSTASKVGLAITQSLDLIGLAQAAMKMWSDVDATMTSVERVLEYTDLTPEEDNGHFVPQETWPQEGNVEFKSVTMQYSPEKPMVLNQVCFTVKSGEKLGIVGRTGAGKTSLVSALFRLFHFEGTILIDGVDTKSVPLQVVRAKISIIPQDPVLFIGSLRKNLDPFGEYSDCQIWQALEEVQMKNLIVSLPSGLETVVIEGGNNFSVGQKQLLCLVRAILRNTKIIVLDEATASIDLKTDELIQFTIRRRFEECTVLTIAHRLNTVMDSDKILVMDSGRVAEFGEPQQLLQDTDGMFYSLVTRNSKEDLGNM